MARRIVADKEIGEENDPKHVLVWKIGVCFLQTTELF